MKLYTKIFTFKISYTIPNFLLWNILYILVALGEFLKSDSCSKIITISINLLFRPSMVTILSFTKSVRSNPCLITKTCLDTLQNNVVNNREIKDKLFRS